MFTQFVSVIVLAAGVLHLTAAATNYCSSTICNVATQTHVACNNNGSLGAACSDDAVLVPITTELRAFLLAKHNTLRNNVAKGTVDGFDPASRMASVQWSTELAKIAEYGVKKCQLKRDACRNTEDFPYVGQNIARSSWAGTNPTARNIANKQIQSWFDESQDATMAEINSYAPPASGASIAQFAQIVQEKATHIGCAILRQTASSLSYQYMFCNYAFALVRTRPVYTTDDLGVGGMGCTATHPTYKFLCSFTEVYDVDTL